jgi:Na+/melibiose symporter-like transporter
MIGKATTMNAPGNSRIRSMTRKIENLLQLASAPRSRSVVTAAAVSFAVCHLVVLATAPTNLDAEIPRQLVHFTAVLCRFAVPFSIMIVGMMHRRVKAKLKV